jgi:hypothetical protein
MALIKQINYPPHRVNYDDPGRSGNVGYGIGNAAASGVNPGVAIQNGIADAAADFAGGPGDDASQGWGPLSMVVEQDTDTVYICVNAAIGAAVWVDIGS